MIVKAGGWGGGEGGVSQKTYLGFIAKSVSQNVARLTLTCLDGAKVLAYLGGG